MSLEDPVEKYLPELSGTPAGQITFRELTTHTSGLPRLPSNLIPSDPLTPYKDYQLSDLMAFLKSFQFEHSKPFSFQYSNLGAGLLGYALSRISGLDYENMIRKLIAEPLEMTDSTVALSSSQFPRTAQGYNSSMEENPLWDLSVLVGAGGVRSSLHDMLKFLNANLSPEATPLTAAIKLSHQVHTADPSVGLGWFFDGDGADNNFNDDLMIWHNGQTGGFYSFVGFKPKKRTGIIILTNTASTVQCLPSIVFGHDCKLPKEYLHSDSQLASFLGKYELAPVRHHATQLIPLDSNHWANKDPNACPVRRSIRRRRRLRYHHFLAESSHSDPRRNGAHRSESDPVTNFRKAEVTPLMTES